MNPLPDMKALKRAMSIESALAAYPAAPLRRAGGAWTGPCPIHGGSQTSRAFHISPDGRGWYCFGTCARGGSVIDLIAALEHRSIRNAAEILRQRFGVG
jgi:DNA primase